MSKIQRVYVAGALTPTCASSRNPAIDYLYNLRTMIRYALDVLFAGFDPFCPALDNQFFFQLRDGERITEPMIKRYSKSWLGVCDAMLLTPGWETSRGTMAEIKFCTERSIPVFDNLQELIAHVQENDHE